MSIFGRLYTGVLDTVYGFKLGRFRKEIEKNEVALQQLIIRRPEPGKRLDLLSVKTILIITNETAEDMVMATPLIRNLALNGYKVDVLASEENAPILERNPYVHEKLVPPGGAAQAKSYVLKYLKDKQYDVVVDLRRPVYTEDFEALLFPQHIVCNFLMGWNRSNIGIYDESLEFYTEPLNFNDVITAFLEYFNVQSKDISYDLPVSSKARENGLHYARNLWRKGGPLVMLYPFTQDQAHSLSEFQVNSLIDMVLESYPFAQIILCGPSDQVSQVKLSTLHEGHVYKFISPVMSDFIALLEFVDVVITPDRSVMYMAAAFEKPTVTLMISFEGMVSKSKERAQNEFKRQIELLKAKFIDGPNIRTGARPEQYLADHAQFFPKSDKAEHIFANTGDMTYLSIDAVGNTFQRLAMQYVHDPQYVSPMKALSYEVKTAETVSDEQEVKTGEDSSGLSAENFQAFNSGADNEPAYIDKDASDAKQEESTPAKDSGQK